MDSLDDEQPTLSKEAREALDEFYKEKERNLPNFEDENIVIEEDWQLSQFWYDKKTIEKLSDIAIKTAGKNGKIALVSCPSLYKTIKYNLDDDGEVNLYEFDDRFSLYGDDYNFFDYKIPLQIPREKKNYYDLVIADPPFLSEECLTKTSLTIRYFTKNNILLCTGAIMADLAKRLLNVEKIAFDPHHKNNLLNEFWCYANFNCD